MSGSDAAEFKVLSISSIANLNYLMIILVVNLIAFLYFYHSPARKAVELRPSIHCFMITFALISVAFIVFASRVIISEVISLTLANALFLLSAYYTKSGFMYRAGKSPPPLRRNYVALSNVVLLTVVNTGVFYFYYDNFAIRATITHCNIALVFFSSIAMIAKDRTKVSEGERIAQVAMWGVVIFTPLAAVLHWLEQSFFTYMSALMFTQAIAVTGLMGGFLTLIMSDLIEDHYHNAVTDPLTGVYNRRFFIDKAPKVIGFSQRKNVHHSVIAADIDNFKRINDEYGHAAGDEALVSFAKLLSKHVRETDVVARFGGEEFVVLLPSATPDVAKSLAVRLCKAVAEHEIQTSSATIKVTASFGVASLTRPEQLSKCLEIADEAMYEAKHKGKNQVVVCGPDSMSKSAYA